MSNFDSSSTITLVETRKGRGCEACNWNGYFIYFTDRPGSPPGNSTVPCQKCLPPRAVIDTRDD